MASGSAPLLPNIHSFMKVVVACPLMEGYGQTESTGASFGTLARDPMTGHVGGPTVRNMHNTE
jgi:long-chain acyl-CoA synthetase